MYIAEMTGGISTLGSPTRYLKLGSESVLDMIVGTYLVAGF